MDENIQVGRLKPISTEYRASLEFVSFPFKQAPTSQVQGAAAVATFSTKTERNLLSVGHLWKGFISPHKLYPGVFELPSDRDRLGTRFHFVRTILRRFILNE